MLPQALLLITLCVGLTHPRSWHAPSKLPQTCCSATATPSWPALPVLALSLAPVARRRAGFLKSIGYSKVLFLCDPDPRPLMWKTRIVTFLPLPCLIPCF